MGTTYTDRTFNDMLKVFMPMPLLMEEVKRRNWFWNKVEKDENWMGGEMIVPFEGAEASSLSLGNLTDASDIAEGTEVKGSISSYRELWGSMLFHEKDLDLHGDMQSSFLSILPGKIEQFVQRMSDSVSHMLLNGDHIAVLTANSDVGGAGLITVDHPERFTIGQKVMLGDDAAAVVSATGYVIAINMDDKIITLSTSRGGAATSYSGAYTTANSSKVYQPGVFVSGVAAKQNIGFTSLKSALLSSANGGSATLYGQTKTTYPYLQAINISGAAYTAASLLENFFDAFFSVVTLGKGMPTSIVCSMNQFKNCAKALETDRTFTVSDKAAGYGWRKISVIGNEGEMEIIGLRDVDGDCAFILDWKALKFYGSHFFDRKRHQNGQEFFLVRATTGYSYIVDIRFYGDLVVYRPSHCGIIHSIPSNLW